MITRKYAHSFDSGDKKASIVYTNHIIYLHACYNIFALYCHNLIHNIQSIYIAIDILFTTEPVSY